MRRFPHSTLLAAVLTAGIAGTAHADADATEVVATAKMPATADDTVAQDAPAPASGDAAAPVSTTPPAAPGQVAADATPVLAPAGSVGGEAEAKKEDKFPLHASASLSNAVGNGMLAPIEEVPAYLPSPMWSSSLGLRGSASLPSVDFLPKLSVSTGVSFSIANWIDSYTNGGVYSRQIRASDVRLGLGAGELYKEPITKIKIGANVNGLIPTSITSRQRNLFTNIGLGVPVSWSSDEASWGSISVSYAPRFGFSLYTAPASTIPCEAGVSLASRVENPLEDGLLPLAYGREAQLLPDGSCILPGRQNIFSISNALSVGWSLGDHSVSAELGHGVGFLSAVRPDPELRGLFSSDQGFTETTNGNVAYSYKVPVDFDLSISAGLGSSQYPFRVKRANSDENGNAVIEQELAFPFWDFFTPSSNNSSAFVDVSIGI